MNKKGITLIELLATIAILAILAVLSSPKILDIYNEGKKEVFENEVKIVFETLENEFSNELLETNYYQKTLYSNNSDTFYTKDRESKQRIKDEDGNDIKTDFCKKDNCVELKISNKLDYSAKLNSKGDIICLKATDGEYVYVSQGLAKSVHDLGQVNKLEADTKVLPDCTLSVNYEDIEEIKVLNIYPDNTGGSWPVYEETPEFTSSVDNIKYQLKKSASLKQWMEEAKLSDSENDYSKGYGKGIIKVTPISFTEFNYKVKNNVNTTEFGDYHLIFIGTWDGNSDSEFSDNMIEFINNWGKPIIIGHDTMTRSTTSGYNFGNEAGSKFGIYIDRSGTNIDFYGNSSPGFNKAYIQDMNSVFVQWPWTINNIELDIPYTHDTQQTTIGDVWITLGSDTVVKYDDDEVINYYFTTYGNTAMIQTGHSNCNATEDEQKIIANLIFYMYYNFYVGEFEGED